MTTTRYDALTVRESNGKSYFSKLGAMFPNKNGDGFTLLLDAVPASNEGQYRILLVTPKERDDNRQSGGQRGERQQPYDDDAPF